MMTHLKNRLPTPQPKAVADASLVSYRKLEHEAFAGQVRSKTWRVAVVVGNEEHSPLWEQRARDYWTRQGNVYGLEMSNFTLSFIDDKDAGPCITTFAVVKQVLPGPRVDSMGRMQ